MFGPRPGTAGFASKKDPRWNRSVRLPNLVVTADWPPEVKQLLDRLKQELGEPPDDLEYWCMKD